MKKIRLSSLILGSSLFLLSACVTPNQAQNSQPGDNTKAATVMGGLLGAIAGMEVSSDDDRVKGGLIGAIVGASAGNIIGQNLDQQAADLRRDLANKDVGILNTGSKLIITMPQDILFALDSASVQNDLRQDLGVVASSLQAYPQTLIEIAGHTDNTGSAVYNGALSQRRADAVARILVNNGVPKNRIRAIGRGENIPIASNLNAAGRSQNRRVEIIIRPNL